MPTSIRTPAERVAELERQLARCLAFADRSAFETGFRRRVKKSLLRYVTGLVLVSLAIFCIVGYLFIKLATLDVFGSQHQQIIVDLSSRCDGSVLKGKKQFDWNKQHHYGAKYAALAEFYSRSPFGDQLGEQISAIFARARTYLEYALRIDREQATTHFELGELDYSYPKKYKKSDLVKPDEALEHYRDAASFCSPAETARGLRADADRMIGTIYFDAAEKAHEPKPAWLFWKASEYLHLARREYAYAESNEAAGAQRADAYQMMADLYIESAEKASDAKDPAADLRRAAWLRRKAAGYSHAAKRECTHAELWPPAMVDQAASRLSDAVDRPEQALPGSHGTNLNGIEETEFLLRRIAEETGAVYHAAWDLDPGAVPE